MVAGVGKAHARAANGHHAQAPPTAATNPMVSTLFRHRRDG